MRKPPAPAVAVDWERLRSQLARAAARTAPPGALDGARAAELLATRARALARPAAARSEAPAQRAVTFSVGRERYAIHLRHVREIVVERVVTPLPGAPAFLAGMASLRGAVLPVIDAQVVFGGVPLPRRRKGHLIVLGDRAADLGLLVDAAEEVRDLSGAPLTPAPPALAETSRSLLEGITADGVIVVDGAALRSDPRFFLGDPH